MNCDYLLMNFCGNDKHRNMLHFPCTDGNITYASDSHVVISVKNNATVYKREKHPNFERVINDFVKEGEIKISKTMLLNTLSKARFEYQKETIQCDKCKGSGYKTCPECEHEHDCKKCDASGEVEDEKALAIRHIVLENDEGFITNYINFQDKIAISPVSVERMLLTMLFFNLAEIIVSFSSKTKKIFFNPVNDVRILMMQSSVEGINC